MKINTLNFLTYYPASEPLNLVEMPDFSNNRDIARYNRFIQNISSIYGSQDSEGNIPIFFTVYSGDKYIPSEESTLVNLEPRKSYYFITRSESALPLEIPMTGHLLPGFHDNDSMPYITSSGINLHLSSSGNPKGLTDNNYAYLSFHFENMQPYEDYKYEFKAAGANWPTTISPISGILKPSRSDYKLDTVLKFCKTTGICDDSDNILEYSLDSNAISQKNLYSVVTLEITPLNSPSESIITDNFSVRCNECIPRLKVSLPSVGLLTTQATAQSFSANIMATVSGSGNTTGTVIDTILPVYEDNRFYTFSPTIENIEPSKSYTYKYRSLGGNWPARIATPMSGVINSDTQLSATVNFCLSSGSCPDQGSLDYNIASAVDRTNLFTTIELTISDDDGIENATSNPLTIYCQDCL